MTDRIAITLAQINPTVGAITANIGRIRAARAEAAARSSDLVVCPQLAVTGCPLGDLATRSFFLDAVEAACAEALAGGTVSRDVVLNILARQREPAPPANIMTPAALTLRHAPIADCARYDNLRKTN